MAGAAPIMRLGTSWASALYLLLHFFVLSPLLPTPNAAELLHPVPESGICRSIDVRNTIENFKQLDGCQVIEGSLQILLFDKTNETQLAQITFPDLVEITDYLLLFRVNGLKSVGQLFPNLAVIRGLNLFPGGKSLVIFEMASLQEIGLHSLTTIMNGVVHIDKNPSLCFVHNIDWTKIMKSDENNLDYNPIIKSFKPDNECPVCPSSVNGKACPRYEKDTNKFLCWNRHYCQKICTACRSRTCNDEGECCDDRCMGGCGSDSFKCTACREFVLGAGEDGSSKCIQKCPKDHLVFLERRCVTRNECINMSKPIFFENIDPEFDNNIHKPYKIHNDTYCLLHCPPNYSGNYTDHSCKQCNNTCRKECPGARIDNINNLDKRLRSCTHITGSIEIQIRGGNQVVKTLEENLGMIEEIDGYLKVGRSFSLVSLNFFKNLKRIRGNELENQHYSLVVYDNQNLQELFDWNTHKDFSIDKGKLFFHFNPKLCLNKIEELRLRTNRPNYTDMEVGSLSNGDKVACSVSKLDVNISNISSKSADLQWHPFELDDPRNLLSYIVYSIEAPSKDVNFFAGRDACGQDNWRVDDLENVPDQDPVIYRLTDLNPFTQYAIFVKTYTMSTERNGSQSDIYYFSTKPAQPTEPTNLIVERTTSDSLTIKWSPPRSANGIISYYIVTGVEHNKTSLQNRDYCRDTVTRETPVKTTTAAPKSKAKINQCRTFKDKNEQKVRNEQEEQERIEFENALHNKVYIKRQGSRLARDVGEIIDKFTYNRTTAKEPVYPNTDHNLTLPADIEKSSIGNRTNPKTNTFTTFSYWIYAPQTEIELKNLHHFTFYTIAVRACRNEEPDDKELTCGLPVDTLVQTLEKKGADNIVNVTTRKPTPDSVTIRWKNPVDPNRKIVSVEIKYKRGNTENAQYMTECISFENFKNYTTRDGFMEYTIIKPYAGNYSLFLRASSLYGEGDPSLPVTFFIDETGYNMYIVIGILGFFFVVLSAVAAFFYKKIMRDKYLLRLVPAVNPDYMSSVYVIDEWEVPRKNVELMRELGQGSFGMVWEGLGHDFKDISGVVRCAVKTVNEHATSRERVEFLNEASVMKAFNTTHVVKLLGVVSQGQPALVIMELMVNGDLKTYLRSHRPETNDGKSPPTLKQILQMAIEISDGMAYLEGKKFVHRDLAARNCMVSEDLTVKIGDFGMTRDIYETDYYRKGCRGLLPVRWMSPESLKDGVFSSSSDAWSYGVVLWEMATLASQPYQGLSNEQVLRYIMDGGMMERPENCPDKLYEVMRLCWHLKPGRRPTFMKLVEMLLPDANENFPKVSFFHSDEGAEVRAIRAAATAAAELAIGDVGDGDDVDASTPLNALPPDVRIVEGYGMSASQRSDSIQSVHIDPNPKFYSISEDRIANGFVGGSRARNGKAQSQC